MNENKVEASKVAAKADSRTDAILVASLVDEATVFIQSRGDYIGRNLKYITGTWQQFKEYCNNNGFELFSSECMENFIKSLSTCTPPFKPRTIERKKGNLKILDLYFRNGTWQKGALNPKPVLSEEFSSFVSAQDALLMKKHYAKISREVTCKQTEDILRFFQKNGVKKFSDVTCDIISAYIISFKGHARTTLRAELSRVRRILHFAYLLEYTLKDFSVYVPSYSYGQSQSHVKIWKSEEINKVLDVVDRSNPKGLRDAAYITIAAELGMRSKDIADLKLSDFDWEACSISFCQSKTGKVNTLPINEKTGQAIIDYLRVRPETDCEYLFVSMNPPYGKMKSFGSSFNRYVHRSGVTVPVEAHHNLHSLRATVATRLLEEGVSPDEIFSFLGHSDRESLHNYIRMDIENLRICALTFENGELI